MDNKEIVRAIKVEKYMEFRVLEDIVEDKIHFGIINPNNFYRINSDNLNYKLTTEQEFDNCDIVLRLIAVNYNFYCFRVLKANREQIVNFNEENESLLSRII